MAATASFLSSVIARLKAFFTKAEPVVEKVTEGAVAATPIVDAALMGSGQPAAAALYNTVSAAVFKAEVAAAAAGAQNGTGAQKTAAVLSDPTVQAGFTTFEQAVNVPQHTIDQQQNYVAGVVATLNGLNQTPAQ